MALSDYLILEDPTTRGLATKVKALMPARQPMGGVMYNSERQTFAQVMIVGTPNSGGGGGGDGGGINWRGDYDGTTAYTDGDAAAYMGSSWLATVDHPANDGVAPTDDGTTPNAGWALIAAKGDDGAPGDDGASATITNATATGLAAGAEPTVELGGTSTARTFAFGIPKGDQGDKGDPGDDATITPAAYVDPASGTFAADLVSALQAAGLMEPAA